MIIRHGALARAGRRSAGGRRRGAYTLADLAAVSLFLVAVVARSGDPVDPILDRGLAAAAAVAALLTGVVTALDG